MLAKRFTVDSDGKYWDKKSNKYVTLDHLFYLVEELEKENKQLKQRIKELELLNDGLNYALQNIRKIDVEIDVGDLE